MYAMRRVLLTVFVVCFIVSCAGKRKRKRDAGDGGAGPGRAAPRASAAAAAAPGLFTVPSSVHDRNLVSEKVYYRSVLREHHKVSKASTKSFPFPVLGYVTPWNNRGYDIAKYLANRFTHISPVWLYVRPSKNNNGYKIDGAHDIDLGWTAEIKQKNPKMRILPRVQIDGFSAEHLQFITQRGNVEKLARRIVKTAKLDGVILEFNSGVSAEPVTAFVEAVRRALGKHRSLGLVLPAQNFRAWGDPPRLAKSVDFVSVMTYDYSSSGSGGVAPLRWMDTSVRAAAAAFGKDKVFMGLHMYGYRFGSAQPTAVTGRDYLKILESNRPRIHWDDEAREHYVIERDGTRVYYPTLQSLAERLALAREVGVGVAIWEIGQGLDYFYDLF